MSEQQVEFRSLAGRLLIASPHADASPYRRSVVLLLEHSEEGAAGVILDGSFRASLQRLRDHLPRHLAGTNRHAAALATVPVRVALWEPGQLELEIASGVWFNAAVDPRQLFSGALPSDWKRLVREVGRSVYRDALGIESFPPAASLN